MSLQIKLKNSVVQDSTPSASDLPEVGELAVNGNINSIGGFMRASDNTIVKIFGPGSVTTPTATTTVSGISELATNSETTTGTATNRVVTPAGLNAVTVAERTTSNTNYVAKAGSTMTGVLTATAGSNSAPAINFGDSDSGIFGGTNTVSLTAGGTTRLTADTGVSVTGTLAVTGAITSTSDLTIADKIIHSGDTDTAIRFPGLNTVSVETGGIEAIRVNSLQALLVGTSAGRSPAAIYARLQVEGTSADTSSISLTRNSADTSSGRFIFNKSRGAAIGSDVVVQNGDGLGLVDFAANDGTDSDSIAARIGAFIDGVPGSNDTPGRLIFATTADGANSPTTRLTIDSAGLVKIPDNGKFVAGDSSDLQIFHDGSKSLIDNSNGVGNLLLYGNGTNSVVIQPVAGENSIVANSNSSVELFFDNSKKLETTSGGIVVEGSIAPTNHVLLEDNKKAQFGNSQDLQIYHDGSNSVIDNLTGGLFIKGGTSNGITLQNRTGNESMAKFIPDGAVELYHNNSKKFETSSTGVTVTGAINASSNVTLSGGSFSTPGNLDLGDSSGTASGRVLLGAGDDLQLYHDGSASYIDNTHSGGLYIRGGSSTGYVVALQAKNSENSVKCIGDGAVELYHNGSKKFETASHGLFYDGTGGDTYWYDGSGSNPLQWLYTDNVKNCFGTGSDLEIYHDGSNSYIKNSTNSLFINSAAHIYLANVDNSEYKAKFHNNSSVELYFDNSKRFETTSTGVKTLGDVSFRTSGNTQTILYDESDGQLEFVDSVKAAFGSGSDLQIYHNGSSSFIQSPSHTLFIQATTIDIGNGAGNEAKAKFIDNGAVELYYDGSKKFETTSTGVQAARYSFDSDNYITCNTSANTMEFVTNSTDIGEFSPSGLMLRDNMQLRLGTAADLRIFHDGSNSFIREVGTGGLRIRSDNTIDIETDSGTDIARFHPGGAVELFNDGSKKFETSSTGATVTGTLKVDTIQNTSAAHSSTTQQIAEGRAKAWCAWDSRGTFAISDSFNVSSVTDNGQGDFTVNIDTDMSNANYAVVAQCAGNGSPNGSHNLMQIHSSNRNTIISPTVGAFRCCVLHVGNNLNQDTDHIAVAVFGDQ